MAELHSVPEQMVHLQVMPDGEIILGLPDSKTRTVCNVEMSAALARQLGEELFKAGAISAALHPE